ncbi:MAG: hypothetical protein LC634_05035 [Sphingomonadales bacterium]|nr:hypothetical protein [Sphingomonadales bacterium]
MKRIVAWIMSACVATAASAQSISMPQSVEEPASSEDPNAINSDELADVIRRGQLIYYHDWAAAATSDVLIEQVPPERRQLVRGWVELWQDRIFTVYYYGSDGNGRFVVASMDFGTEGVTNVAIPAPDDRQALPPDAIPYAEARDAALNAAANSGYGLCSGPSPNTVVIPSEPEGTISVYILSPQTQNDVFQAGGHYRYDVGPDGEIEDHRRFMNSCLALGAENDGTGNPEAVGYGISHLLDPHPTEIHIFLSLLSRRLISVVTTENGLIWMIRNGRFVSKDEDPSSEND